MRIGTCPEQARRQIYARCRFLVVGGALLALLVAVGVVIGAPFLLSPRFLYSESPSVLYTMK